SEIQSLNFLIIGFFILQIIVFVPLVTKLLIHQNTHEHLSIFISPLAEAKMISESEKSDLIQKPGYIPILIDKYFNDLDGKFSIVIQHFQTGEYYAINEHEIFQPASLYKLWVMAATMQKVNKGELSKDTQLTENVQSLHDAFNISSESAELINGIISFTVNDAIHQMITISHNYAALLLSKTIRNKTIQSFLDTNGFYESKIGQPPQITAADTALFFEKLYRGELINPESSQEMMKILKNQKIRRKLPKHLPKNVIIAHKTGELGLYSHDAGIVFHETGDYMIVVLTETQNPSETEERIADFSRDVFMYFTNF
ncbi:MAG: class A beta-lactamase-related serine hydrolase, partial [Candidatus Calescibacterium sp.]|nr:class A beta-lactamase-related serine hydrolase [Candidatus Calescibacterium sp.]